MEWMDWTFFKAMTMSTWKFLVTERLSFEALLLSLYMFYSELGHLKLHV